jgi:hypothetical protein
MIRFVKNLKPDNLTDKRSILLKKIKERGFPKNEVFVSIDEFFEGNNDDGSIGANIYPDPPSLADFYNTLKEIKKDSRTDELLVRIADIDDTEWFYTDMIYISGRYKSAEIKKLFKLLRPDEVYEGMMYDEEPSNIPQLKPGSKAYSVWWD